MSVHIVLNSLVLHLFCGGSFSEEQIFMCTLYIDLCD